MENPPQSYGASPAIITQCYLPTDTGERACSSYTGLVLDLPTPKG